MNNRKINKSAINMIGDQALFGNAVNGRMPTGLTYPAKGETLTQLAFDEDIKLHPKNPDNVWDNSLGSWIKGVAQKVGGAVQTSIFDPINKNLPIAKQIADWAGDRVDQADAWMEDNVNLDQKIKTGVLAVPRSSYLGLMRLNIFGMASYYKDLMTSNPELYAQFAKKYYNLGGNRTELARVIEKGAKEKEIIIPALFKKFQSAVGNEIKNDFRIDNVGKEFKQSIGSEFQNAVDPVSLTAIVTSATAILVPTISIAGKAHLEKKEAEYNKEQAEIALKAQQESSKLQQIKSALTSKTAIMVTGITVAGLVVLTTVAVIIKRKKSK